MVFETIRSLQMEPCVLYAGTVKRRNIGFDIRVYGKEANGDPNAYKSAFLVSRITPALAPGQTTQFRFAVPGMTPEDFTAAYVASMTFGGIASPTAE